MPDLVAIDLPGGPPFVEALRRVWSAGDAAAPLDPRLNAAAAAPLLDALRPTAVIDASGERRALSGGLPVEKGDALVVATSGSTSQPRGVVLTHEAVEASAAATSARLGIDPTRHSWLACLPLAHIGGLSVITRALWAGSGLEVMAGFDAARVEAMGRAGGATHVSLVATTLRRIDPSVFSCVLLGGAAPPARLPSNVVTTYGSTETGSGIVYDGQPLQGTEVVEGDGTPGGGQVGELLVRGPTLLRAYRDGTDPRVAGPDRRGGWLATGDAGRVAPGGQVTVEGRMAEVVVTGGEKVWPAAVEAVLASHPAVESVAVWKRPDPEWGERVVAWVVPRADVAPPSLGDLRHHVADVLPPWAAPRQLELCAALPTTPSGKVRRRQLR